MTFYGNQVKINGPADPSHGMMAVSVDDGEEIMVDTYSANRDSKTLYTSPMMELGNHTLKVRVTGQKNPAAKNCYVDFQNVEIVPEYTRVQSYEEAADNVVSLVRDESYEKWLDTAYREADLQIKNENVFKEVK